MEMQAPETNTVKD